MRHERVNKVRSRQLQSFNKVATKLQRANESGCQVHLIRQNRASEPKGKSAGGWWRAEKLSILKGSSVSEVGGIMKAAP